MEIGVQAAILGLELRGIIHAMTITHVGLCERERERKRERGERITTQHMAHKGVCASIRKLSLS